MKVEDAGRFPPQMAEMKDGNKVCFRLLSTKDAEALGDFYESIPPEDVRFYCPHPLTRDEARKKTARANAPHFICMIGEDSAGSIGGYAWCRWELGDEKSVFGICVRRICQGTGLGLALMERLVSIAEEHAPPIMSLTVQKANPRGVVLYQKMGFRIIREQLRGGDGEPEYYMERVIRLLKA